MKDSSRFLALREKIRIEKSKSKIIRSYDELKNTIRKRSIAREEEKECEFFFNSIVNRYGDNVVNYKVIEKVKENTERIKNVSSSELLVACDVEFIGCWIVFKYKSIYAVASFEIVKGGYKYKSLTFR